jgi:hypothetical protein
MDLPTALRHVWQDTLNENPQLAATIWHAAKSARDELDDDDVTSLFKNGLMDETTLEAYVVVLGASDTEVSEALASM